MLTGARLASFGSIIQKPTVPLRHATGMSKQTPRTHLADNMLMRARMPTFNIHKSTPRMTVRVILSVIAR